MTFYAGIGSRETPDDVLELMFQIGYRLATRGYVLRSGCASGADSAFEEGCTAAQGEAELFLPWPGFEGRAWERYYTGVELYERPADWTFPIAQEHHPRWSTLSDGARKLHARNVHQMLGWKVNPFVGKDGKSLSTSKFVVCWTKGGQGGGGTGQALRIAKDCGVPIFDLAVPETRKRIEGWLAG